MDGTEKLLIYIHAMYSPKCSEPTFVRKIKFGFYSLVTLPLIKKKKKKFSTNCKFL